MRKIITQILLFSFSSNCHMKKDLRGVSRALILVAAARTVRVVSNECCPSASNSSRTCVDFDTRRRHGGSENNLSCLRPVNRQARPSCCLYSIIFSCLPVSILDIHCSNKRTRPHILARSKGENVGKHARVSDRLAVPCPPFTLAASRQSILFRICSSENRLDYGNEAITRGALRPNGTTAICILSV